MTTSDAVRHQVSPALSRPSPPSPAELDVYDLLIGLTLATAERTIAGWRVGRHALSPVVGFALRPPVLPTRLQPIAWLQTRARLGRSYRVRVARGLQKAVPALVDAVLAGIDLDSVVHRIDLPALAREVIDDIDLPEIIRESTGTMSSEAVVGIRMQGIQADDGVSRAVDRVLLRRGVRKTQTGTPTGANGETAH